MKIKNKLFVFLGIFIFMIIPKNVFATEIYPFDVKINNVDFTNISTSYNNHISGGGSGSSLSFTISLESYSWYNTSGSSQSYGFDVFPYTLIYFQTWRTLDEFSISKNTSCNTSCFSNYSISVKQIGKDAVSGRYRYVLILENKKWTSDIPTGGVGTSVYHIDDVITLTPTTSSGAGFIVYQVLLTDNISILDNSSVDIDSLISNATTNSQNIINNNTSNSQNIINNQNQNQQQTNEKLDDVKSATEDVNDTMKDETPVSDSDVSNKASEWSSKLANTGPVSQIILLPITLLNGYVSGWNSSCSSYNIGNFFGTDIVFPCINLRNYFGATLWGVLDALLSGFMVLAIGKKFVKIFNDFTNLRDNQMDELYGGGK